MPRETFDEILRLRAVSKTFSGHYHHYSEGLFLHAAGLLEEGNIAIDAGCYVGDNAFAFARRVGDAGRVFTFEPDPRLYDKILQRLATGEEGASSIELNNCALGNSEGEVEFLIVNELEGHSGLAPKAHYGRDVTYSKITCLITKLDTLLIGKCVDLNSVKMIKFDIEGAELNALRGAVATISIGQPVIMFEYGALEAFGFSHDQYFDFFNAINYQIVTCFDMDIVDTRSLATSFGWNLFALPRSSPFLRGELSALIRTHLPAFIALERDVNKDYRRDAS